MSGFDSVYDYDYEDTPEFKEQQFITNEIINEMNEERCRNEARI